MKDNIYNRLPVILNNTENHNNLYDTLSSLDNNLDKAIAKGSNQEDILLIMKSLLNDIKICNSMTEYLEEVTYE